MSQKAFKHKPNKAAAVKTYPMHPLCWLHHWFPWHNSVTGKFVWIMPLEIKFELLIYQKYLRWSQYLAQECPTLGQVLEPSLGVFCLSKLWERFNLTASTAFKHNTVCRIVWRCALLCLQCHAKCGWDRSFCLDMYLFTPFTLEALLDCLGFLIHF